MEIDIFPIPPKKGLGQSISKILLYGLILLYIIAGYKTAIQLISEEDELLRVFATIPFFVGYYTIHISYSWSKTRTLCLRQIQQERGKQPS